MYTFLPFFTILRLLDINETYPATKDPHVTRWGLVFQADARREHPSSLSSSPIISKKKMEECAVVGATNAFLISREIFFLCNRT